MTIHEQEAEEALGKWSSSKYAVSKKERITHRIWRNNFEDFVSAYPVSDEEVIISRYTLDKVERYNYFTGELVWNQDGLNGPRGIDYDQNTGRLVVPYSNGVAILDSETGKIVKNVTSSGGNDLTGSEVMDVFFSPDDLNRVVFCLLYKHVLIKYDTKTDSEVARFGVWGTSGGDLSHLNNPCGVALARTDYFVCDTSNHRMLRISEDLNTVQDMLLVPSPVSARQVRWGSVETTRKRIQPLVVSFGVGVTPQTPRYSFALNWMRGISWIQPSQIDWPRFNKDLDRMWGGRAGIIDEYNLKAIWDTFDYPVQSWPLLNKEAVTAAEGYTSMPLPGTLMRDVTINLFSDQAGDLYIDVPDENSTYGYFRGTGLGVPTGYGWNEYLSRATSANTMETVNIAREPPLFRIRYSPDADCTATLRVHSK